MMMTTMMWIALKTTLILAGAGLASVLLRKASASLRHLVWASALMAVLAVPFVEASGLELRVPVPWLAQEQAGTELASSGMATEDRPGAPTPAMAVGGAPAARATEMVESPVTAPLMEKTSTGSKRSGGVAAVTEAPSEPGSVRRARASAASAPGQAAGFREAQSQAAPRAADTAASPSWILLIAGVWGVGTLLLLGAMVRSHWTAYGLTTRAIRPAPARMLDRLDRLAERYGMAETVRLVISARLGVPATWGLHAHTIVLPSVAMSWSTDRLDRVLLHELAHVRRRDCATQLLGDAARAVHWPNPLAWVAAARLRVESERAADDEVVASGDAPSAYASDLVALARSLRASSGAPSAVLAMAGEEGIVGRLHSILDPDRPRGRMGRSASVAAGCAAVAFAFAVTGIVAVAQERPSEPVPAVVTEPVPESPATVAEPEAVEAAVAVMEAVGVPEVGVASASMSAPEVSEEPHSAPSFFVDQSAELCVFRADSDRKRNSVSSTDRDVIRIRWEVDGCTVAIDVEGEVNFEADDSGVRSMGDGAVFEVNEQMGRTSRRVRFTGRSSGIESRYWVNGDSREWGAEADAWIARVLPEIFRHTTINAEARVRRMLAEGGPDRVFSEVDQMRSDHVRRRYLELMMQEVELSEREYTRVIGVAGTMESDHSTGELLLGVVAKAGLQPAFQGPMLEAAESIESDHQRTRVLQALLTSNLTSTQIDAVLRSAQSIESDHSLGQVLQVIADRGDLSVAARESFMETLATIESDHQQVMVLNSFLEAGRLQDEELNRILAMTREIESDHSLGQILQRIAQEYPLDGAQASAYLAAARGLESDHEMAMTASVFLDRGPLDETRFALVLDLLEQVESDHQRGMVLSQLIDNREMSVEELVSFLEMAEGISSDNQLATLLTQLAHVADLDDAGVLGVLWTARRIGSDHSQAQVLTNLAENADIRGEALELYHELADGLGRHQRDQVLASIARR